MCQRGHTVDTYRVRYEDGNFLLHAAVPGVKPAEVTDPRHVVFLSLITWPNVGSFSQGQTRPIPNTKAISSAKCPIALPKHRGSRAFQTKGCKKKEKSNKANNVFFQAFSQKHYVILAEISVNNSVWGKHPVRKI